MGRSSECASAKVTMRDRFAHTPRAPSRMAINMVWPLFSICTTSLTPAAVRRSARQQTCGSCGACQRRAFTPTLKHALDPRGHPWFWQARRRPTSLPSYPRPCDEEPCDDPTKVCHIFRRPWRHLLTWTHKRLSVGQCPMMPVSKERRGPTNTNKPHWAHAWKAS